MPFFFAENIFFSLFFLGMVVWKKGTGILTTCVFFLGVGGRFLVFFWLAGVKGTAFLEQRPEMQTFFAVGRRDA